MKRIKKYNSLPVEGGVSSLDEEVAQERSKHVRHLFAHGVNAAQHHELHLQEKKE